ncbi:hypothetical protein OH76DRAFT_1350943, partial [Lentinus brumalis]
HASGRNVIERIFGVLKRRYGILDRPSEFDMDVQAQIPAGLVGVHNFIREHDPQEILDFKDILDDVPAIDGYGDLAEGPPTQAEQRHAEATRDHIAQAMWEDYQAHIGDM